MEGAGVCASIAMAMIAEGEDQVIEVDHRTILKTVMEGLGSPDTPVYTFYDCGPQGVRASIKLNVGAARYCGGEKLYVVEFEGEIAQSRVKSERSAVMKALKHLNEKHKIMIRDFSRRVVHEIHDDSAFGSVNSAMYNIDKLLVKWGEVIAKCERLAMKMGPLKDSIDMKIDIYKSKMNQARETVDDLEANRKKYHSKQTESHHEELRKGYLQDVYLTSKGVLEYVLTYIGGGKPTYTNGPADGCMVKATVNFYIPDRPGVEICGNITIKGKHTTSRMAEEEAAFNALMYMEKKFSLKIKHLYHEERVDAEKDERMLVNLLDHLVDVGKDVEKYWGKMGESIAIDREHYMYDATRVYAAPDGVGTKEEYKLCAGCLEEMEKACKKSLEECAVRIKDLNQVEYKLNEWKMDMGMD